MPINEKIFKTYDIRGIYPDELNDETAYKLGRALVRKTKAKKVVVGRDMRLSSPSLSENLIRGITDEGADVDDIGLVVVDTIYFAQGKFDYDLGAMITASHNPKEYGGFKMVFNNVQFIRGIDIKKDVLNLPELKSDIKKGEVKNFDIIPDYLNHIFSFVDKIKIKPVKIVVDAGNGMAGKFIPLILEKIPQVELVSLNFELDGNFPAHPSNPLLPESRIEISRKIKEVRADFGIIFDGDTDRIFLVDENGEFITGDFGLLILVKYLLQKNPGKGIAYNLICSKSVPEFIKKFGGRPIRSAVGYANLAKAMKDNDGIMSGEVSAHYAFRDNFYADSGMIAFLIYLEILSNENKKLSEIINEFRKYYRGDEINIKVKNIQEKLNLVKEKYSDGEVDEIDGITVQYKNWWVNVRPSNTEPLLRITVEAGSEILLKNKQRELVKLIADK